MVAGKEQMRYCKGSANSLGRLQAAVVKDIQIAFRGEGFFFLKKNYSPIIGL